MRYVYLHKVRKGANSRGRKKISNNLSSTNIARTPDTRDYDLSDPLWYYKFADDTRQMNDQNEIDNDNWNAEGMFDGLNWTDESGEPPSYDWENEDNDK